MYNTSGKLSRLVDGHQNTHEVCKRIAFMEVERLSKLDSNLDLRVIGSFMQLLGRHVWERST